MKLDSFWESPKTRRFTRFAGLSPGQTLRQSGVSPLRGSDYSLISFPRIAPWATLCCAFGACRDYEAQDGNFFRKLRMWLTKVVREAHYDSGRLPAQERFSLV